MADPKIDPDIAIVALGAMTQRFPELWLVEQTHEFDFDAAVDQLSRLFANALGITESENVPRKTRGRSRKELLMRAVIVGASSGLGRCIAVGLAQRGAEVALLARRHDWLVDAAKEAGNGALAIACDVTDQDVVRAGHSKRRQGPRRDRRASSTPPASASSTG